MESNVEKKLREAYAKWVDKNADEKLSVSSLCEMAEVSRAGFYLYYKDAEDFINKTREYMLHRILEQFVIIAKNYRCPESCELIFDKTDLRLYKFYNSQKDYWGFVESAYDSIDLKAKEIMINKWGADYCSENKPELDFIFTGSIALLFTSLEDYDEEKIISNLAYMPGIIDDVLNKK